MNTGTPNRVKDHMDMGIPLIDTQHQAILSIINSLAFLVDIDEADFYLTTTMNIINSYTKIHFAVEEELMRKAGYSGFAAHKAIHERMVKEAYAAANQSLRTRDPKMYLDFLTSWWVDHIADCDVDYVSCLKAYLQE
jgi:hemerythrin-like metal-binding domain